MKKSHNILLLFLLNQFSLSLNAQNDMLIEQLANKIVTRENFDKKGELINKQSFQIGKIKELSGYYEIEMLTKTYDSNGKLLDEYKAEYKCKPNESSLVVMILPFFNPNSKKTMIKSKAVNFKELYNLRDLKTIEVEISFDSGVLNFFGSKSIIKIYERALLSNKEGKVIQSKLNVKAYALGIRVKNLNYKIIEKLTDNGQLLFQKFTEKDESYFTMTYKNIE
ncbi:MAG: hypothetical protein GXO84_03715 [Chlorobi bacterium]|nr:hypothetical protein [Chlorobiota bacterium]